ncbi:uroporphyrinogen-III C-methyltransferase [Roseivirga sp. BDSF3-8]|uniref:uroporphyrinogen-III C-methyltransferase n=1 Tax=Roseivirga sp. BDSF3-8 TaxID=3241598 RepID=UPI0035325AF2
MKGRLTLVGAGPGDPELLTIKGAKALADADVVLYDALVQPEMLAYTKSRALKIFVGKRAGAHSASQDDINRLIVDHASRGRHVVRLKGGDPFVFARGKEEMDYAAAFGIETDVVIGISSINLPGHYGIPLTCRGINESFWVVTATTRSGELSKDVSLAAQSSATAVFFMGLRKVEEIADLYARYQQEDLPAAIISRGSLAEGRVYTGLASKLVSLRDENRIAAPALVIVGKAVGSASIWQEASQPTELKNAIKRISYA